MRALGAALTPVVRLGDRFPELGRLAASVLGIHPGVERWDVKTLTDSGANVINWAPRDTTITALATIKNIQPMARLAGLETAVWRLEATLTSYKLELDGDYHLVLMDASGATMIAEIPYPA